jgi:hypothetical protein
MQKKTGQMTHWQEPFDVCDQMQKNLLWQHHKQAVFSHPVA